MAGGAAGRSRSGIYRRLNIAVVGGGLYSDFPDARYSGTVIPRVCLGRLAGDSGVSGRLANDYSSAGAVAGQTA